MEMRDDWLRDIPCDGKNYTVIIRKNEDGSEREYRNDGPPWNPNSAFWWGEGNGSCDCNREIFFRRALGQECLYPICGESAYDIVAIRFDDGQEFRVPADARAGKVGA